MDKKIFPDEPEIPILPNLFTAGNLAVSYTHLTLPTNREV